MDIIQVVIIGMIGTILTITVKQYKPRACGFACACDRDSNFVFWIFCPAKRA